MYTIYDADYIRSTMGRWMCNPHKVLSAMVFRVHMYYKLWCNIPSPKKYVHNTFIFKYLSRIFSKPILWANFKEPLLNEWDSSQPARNWPSGVFYNYTGWQYSKLYSEWFAAQPLTRLHAPRTTTAPISSIPLLGFDTEPRWIVKISEWNIGSQVEHW